MNELMKTSAKFFFVALAVLIIGWTGWHTYSVMYAATKDQVASVYGLIVFEGGMLTWFTLFMKNAESMGQHVVALFGTFIGVLMVCVAFYISMQVDPKEIVQYGSIGRWLIVVATIETLVFVLLYELFNPKVWEELMEMIHVAMLNAKAEKKAQAMIEKDSDALAEEIARNRKDRAFANARLQGIKSVPMASPNHPMNMPPARSLASDVAPVEERGNGTGKNIGDEPRRPLA